MDWSDERATLLIFKLTLLSTVVVLLGAMFIPFNWILLVGGVLALISNTALFQVSLRILPPIIQMKLSMNLKSLKQYMKKGNPISTEKPETTMASITVFENQRLI